MKRTRVYLDNCCYNRPYDNQNNIVIHIETEAKLYIQDLILKGELELIWSFMMDYENNDNPFEVRKSNIGVWKFLSVFDCNLCDDIASKANDLMKLGLKSKDAAHIACAIFSEADYFLTTDRKILNKPVTEIFLINPVDFVGRYLNEQ